jgi:hypothetical protein
MAWSLLVEGPKRPEGTHEALMMSVYFAFMMPSPAFPWPAGPFQA